MSNPLFQQLCRQQPQNEMERVLNDFRQFRQQMGNINPQQEVMKYLQSGRINQQQLNQFQNMASRLTGFLK